MSTIKIEKGVAPPSPRNTYPWKTMEVGDSFLWPGDPQRGRGQASTAGRSYSRKFVTRITPEGLRIWRVK